jgi:class 3 adenylate cyclase
VSSGIRLTIGTKLISLLAFLLVSSLAGLAWVLNDMFMTETRALIQRTTLENAGHSATEVREILRTVIRDSSQIGQGLINLRSGQASDPALLSRHPEVLSVLLVAWSPSQPLQLLSSVHSSEGHKAGLAQHDKILTALQNERSLPVDRVFQGEEQFGALRSPSGGSLIVAGIPFAQENGRFTRCLIVFVSDRRFHDSFSELPSGVARVLLDRRGVVLTHSPDWRQAAPGVNLGDLPIVQDLLSGKLSNKVSRYVDPRTSEPKLGAYHEVGIGGLAVVASISEAKPFEMVRRISYRAALVAFMILCVAFLAGYLYSGTITWRLRQLMEAAQRISLGDFFVELEPKGSDEVTHLSLAFNEMARGLEDRKRVKEIFNKFHNKEIAEKLLSGELKLGGEKKEAIILFCDIRGFTSLSESMAAEEVVEMLNEYLRKMVAVIRQHGGIVDKFVGDAIMAIWGIPLGAASDLENAISACLAIRKELAALNELRIRRKQAPIRIGMGLNMGAVIAGNIGSEERMDYTVIGDTVNLASRLEELTKVYGTDLLVTGSIAKAVHGKFVFQQCDSAKVRGKSLQIEIHRVLGYIRSGKQILVTTPYSESSVSESGEIVRPPPRKPNMAIPLPPPPPPPGTKTKKSA